MSEGGKILITHLAAHSRSVVLCYAALSLFSVIVSCSHVWAGKPPPCPSPSDGAIENIAALVEENESDPSRYSFVLVWVSEIERFCSSLNAARGDD